MSRVNGALCGGEIVPGDAPTELAVDRNGRLVRDGIIYDSNGRPERRVDGPFVKGWRGGPGRPKRETEEAYLKAIRDAVGPEEIYQLCSQALHDALNGKSQGTKKAAREWIGKYALPYLLPPRELVFESNGEQVVKIIWEDETNSPGAIGQVNKTTAAAAGNSQSPSSV